MELQLTDYEERTSYYVGESDGITKRLLYHQRTMPRRTAAAVRSAWVLGLPHSEKSTAKLLERELQRALADQVRLGKGLARRC